MQANEWIDYDGSGQPVDDEVMVDVMTRFEVDFCVFESDPQVACSWEWRGGFGDNEIVKYKVVENG